MRYSNARPPTPSSFTRLINDRAAVFGTHCSLLSIQVLRTSVFLFFFQLLMTVYMYVLCLVKSASFSQLPCLMYFISFSQIYCLIFLTMSQRRRKTKGGKSPNGTRRGAKILSMLLQHKVWCLMGFGAIR